MANSSMADLKTNLLGACTEHALNTETHRHDVHSWTPVPVQDRETNMAIAVDVGMNWDVLPCEYYLRKGGRKEGGRGKGKEGGGEGGGRGGR